jgi:hypothetical protein
MDGVLWTWFASIAAATYSQFGFFVGNDSFPGNMYLGARVLKNTFTTSLNVPQTAITNLTSAGTNIWLVTSPSHGLLQGDNVFISGVAGISGINEVVNTAPSRVVIKDANSFYVYAGVSGTYTSGGIVTCVSR